MSSLRTKIPRHIEIVIFLNALNNLDEVWKMVYGYETVKRKGEKIQVGMKRA